MAPSLLAFLIFPPLVLLGVGCREPSPPSLLPRALGTPSALIAPPLPPTGPTASLPFDLPHGRLYAVNGSWDGPDQVKGKIAFKRHGVFTLERGDNADVDPKEFSTVMDRWMGSGGRVLKSADQPVVAGVLVRTVEYETELTAGTVILEIAPVVPARKVDFRITIHEWRRR